MTTSGQNSESPTPAVETIPPIRYESYLLRLRRVNGPDGERCQACLRCIHDDEERYFNSLRELMAYLQMQDNSTREEGPSPCASGEG